MLHLGGGGTLLINSWKYTCCAEIPALDYGKGKIAVLWGGKLHRSVEVPATQEST